MLRTIAFVTLGPDLLLQRNPSHSGRQGYYMRNACKRQLLFDSIGSYDFLQTAEGLANPPTVASAAFAFVSGLEVR